MQIKRAVSHLARPNFNNQNVFVNGGKPVINLAAGQNPAALAGHHLRNAKRIHHGDARFFQISEIYHVVHVIQRIQIAEAHFDGVGKHGEARTLNAECRNDIQHSEFRVQSTS
ncbi:MAG TPA: hypothetical protein PKY60_01710 [Thermoflexales bacterium]|nr:hypothetical protein [Thermoflexales bacterium]